MFLFIYAGAVYTRKVVRIMNGVDEMQVEVIV